MPPNGKGQRNLGTVTGSAAGWVNAYYLVCASDGIAGFVGELATDLFSYCAGSPKQRVKTHIR